MISKTEELLNEMLKGDSLQEREQSWIDFVKNHGYAIVSISSSPEIGDFFPDHIIPGTYFVDEPQFYGWYDKLEGVDYPKISPQDGFKRDGGKFINDIYGVEMDCYLDTPENRAVIMDFMMKNPQYSIENWQEEVFNDQKWQEYQESFRKAENCHFFGEIQLDEKTFDLLGMSGNEAAEKFGYGAGDIVAVSIGFPNDIDIQFNILIEEGDSLCSYEAVMMENMNYTGHNFDCDSILNNWEFKDDYGNIYHIKVSPPMLVEEKVNSLAHDETEDKNMTNDFHCDLYADSAKEDKMIEDLLHLTGDEAREKYDLNRDFTISHTAQFNDGIEIDIKLCLADSESYNWCEAVIFQNGHEIGCSDVSEDFFGPWELEDREGNKYCVDMHPFRDLVRDNTGVSRVSDSVLKSSKKEQANLAR